MAIHLRSLLRSLTVVVWRPDEDGILLSKFAVFFLTLSRHIYDIDIGIKEVQDGRDGRIVLYLALSYENEDTINIVKNVLRFSVFTNEVVTPSSGIQYLEIPPGIGITTAYIIGIVFDLSSKYSFASPALNNV
jgi:hypothetical protein